MTARSWEANHDDTRKPGPLWGEVEGIGKEM